MITALVRGPFYWAFLLLLSLVLMATALVYQYGLDYPPCVLCIHVRMLTVLLGAIALAMLFLRRWATVRLAGHVATAAVLAWLAERSWQLLATERGWILGSCDMQSGLPTWFALERWFPRLFEIHEPCGYTPDMPWGLTMAESLVGLSWPLAAVAACLAIVAAMDLGRGRRG